MLRDSSLFARDEIIVSCFSGNILNAVELLRGSEKWEWLFVWSWREVVKMIANLDWLIEAIFLHVLTVYEELPQNDKNQEPLVF